MPDFLSFDQGYKSAGRLRQLKKAMQTVFPRQPAILVLTDAIRQKEAVEPRPSAQKPCSLKYSIPEDQLPLAWREALEDMAAGFDRNCVAAPSPNMIATYRMKLRQIACSARKAGLPEEISVDAVIAYARDMRARNLAAATQLASFSAIQKSARYLAADPETVELLAELVRDSDAKSRHAPKQKYAKLQQTGYSPVAIIDLADEVLAQADELPCPKSRQEQRNRAAALALYSVLPLRLADTRLRFGEHVTWNGQQYALHCLLSKHRRRYDAEFDPRLNRFIDALILRGCDEAWLDHMRDECLRSNRPLFIRNDGKGVAYNYVSDCWRKQFGTGEHIARTILHTFLGVELGPVGTDLALAANGQRSPATAQAYQDDVVKKVRRLRGQESLAEIAASAVSDLFEFI